MPRDKRKLKRTRQAVKNRERQARHRAKAPALSLELGRLFKARSRATKRIAAVTAMLAAAREHHAAD